MNKLIESQKDTCDLRPMRIQSATSDPLRIPVYIYGAQLCALLGRRGIRPGNSI